MGRGMMGQGYGWGMGPGMMGHGWGDDQTVQKNYETSAALQKQMIDNATETQKRIEAVLTPKQREELRRNGPY